MITKSITETTECGNFWVITDARINFSSSTIGVRLSGYDTEEDIEADNVCHTRGESVSSTEWDGTQAKLEALLKADENSVFYTG